MDLRVAYGTSSIARTSRDRKHPPPNRAGLQDVSQRNQPVKRMRRSAGWHLSEDKKTKESERPAAFYCRKLYYALPVQALVDSRYRLLCFSARCVGSTHDSMAHAVSSLGEYLRQGRRQMEFWISGDEAYHVEICLSVHVWG